MSGFIWALEIQAQARVLSQVLKPTEPSHQSLWYFRSCKCWNLVKLVYSFQDFCSSSHWTKTNFLLPVKLDAFSYCPSSYCPGWSLWYTLGQKLQETYPQLRTYEEQRMVRAVGFSGYCFTGLGSLVTCAKCFLLFNMPNFVKCLLWFD